MKRIVLIIMVSALYSCGGAKYNYFFDTGRQLDFSHGKWILNSTKSNSRIFDNELYDTSLKGFKNILGDSLVEMNDLRSTNLIAPKIKFELSEADLNELKRNTDCDYIINIGGNVISDGLGTLSFSDQNENSSNRASVSISIYDLNTKTLISSSQVYGKIENRESVFPEDNKHLPSINPSSHMIMLKGAEKLIRKYGKNQLIYNK
ncbi:hypothetical protein KCTC52924_03364 [Arenibacter antarcticus]|uniref:Lipoprotein n=1 Tax=Arenibacter antarcticus TaxID=2040469 RepID=A0ABW5VGU4_9FLAO|nr:hypothetical protein [Arenibacter sp. H213]MCM4166431.1 hypothetical protein [Arenibacter sp. H213]